MRDETLHTLSIIKLHNVFLQENPEIHTPEYDQELLEICLEIIRHEDAFIDLAFEFGDVEGLKASEVKQYIRYIADRRLRQLNLNPYFNMDKNPLPWMDLVLNGLEHTNFFENRATEYTKAATRGTWDEAFDNAQEKTMEIR